MPLPTPDAAAAGPALDGVTSAPDAVRRADPETEAVTRAKRTLIILFGFLSLLYAAACIALMSLLPSTDAAMVPVKTFAIPAVGGGAAVFLIIGLVLFLRLAQATSASSKATVRAVIRIALMTIPGILLSGATLYVISQEPTLPLDISPSAQADLVAPLALTLDATQAVEILARNGLRVAEYGWFSGNPPKLTEVTLTPKSTFKVLRAGIYVLTVQLKLADGTKRAATRRIIVPKEVFSIAPFPPIVEQPATFSVASLLSDPKELTQVQWDFDGDGKPDETSTSPEVTHVFYVTGDIQVTATVDIKNQVQRTYQRTVSVVEPPSLPFPISISSEPKKLVGPAPFGVTFQVQTSENIREYAWSYGDTQQERGGDLHRVSHVYDKPGTYSVVLRARSASGTVAEIASVVRVTDRLSLQDLQFDGVPKVSNNAIEGEVPLIVKLTPKTSVPLVQFSWESDEGIDGGPKGTSFEGVFRKEGTYTITLIAQDATGNSNRIPITVRVLPPAAEPEINMRPESGSAPLHVVFDASNTFIPDGEQVAGFRWEFGEEGDGKQAELGGARVEHTYVAPGEYTVRLTVVMTDGKEFSAERKLVVRKPPLTACGTPSRLSVQAGGSVQFDASCTTGAPVSTVWDVRRKEQPDVIIAQGPQQKYVHVFEQAGTYIVRLTVKEAGGYEDSKSFTISVTP